VRAKNPKNRRRDVVKVSRVQPVRLIALGLIRYKLSCGHYGDAKPDAKTCECLRCTAALGPQTW